MNTNINNVWANIVKHRGKTFWQKNGKPFTYVVKNNYIIVNEIKSANISKANIEKALLIQNPSPKKIRDSKIWAQSCVYGIITDNRIKNTIN